MFAFLDAVAERILSLYKVTGFLNHTRLGLGIVSVIALFTGPSLGFSLTGSGVWYYTLFGGLAALNTLHLFAAVYLGVRDASRIARLSKDNEYLESLGAKLKSGATLPESDFDLYANFIEAKQSNDEPLDDFEFTFSFVHSEDFATKILYQSTDSELISALAKIKACVPEQAFRQISSRVSVRLARIQRQN